MAAISTPPPPPCPPSGNGNGTRNLGHDPGLILDWTLEEQTTIDDLLKKHASEAMCDRYANISKALKGKTVRDVALRIHWMNKNEYGKRGRDVSDSKKNKGKKAKVTETLPKSAEIASCSNAPPNDQPTPAIDNDYELSYQTIGGITGQLLKANSETLDQISANFSGFKIHENFDLFSQARNTILSVLNEYYNVPEMMLMPPLPVRLNEDLANTFIPPSPPKRSLI